MITLILLCIGSTFFSQIKARPFDPSSGCLVSLGGASFAGTLTDAGACRYTVKYAHSAARWGYSWPVTDLPNYDVASLPPACPQDNNVYVEGRQQDEDCLYAIVYTPTSIQTKLPVFVWVHGGSFIRGSASAPGLDASNMAVKGDIVVVILQYRLGVFGFLPPTSSPATGDPNLGLLDLINGLQAVSTHVELFGGDQSKITVGGQSSGAGMIRSLLAVPSSRRLFKAAILQSDPLSYSLSSPDMTSQLQSSYYSARPLSDCRDLACLQNVSISDMIAAQMELVGYAPFTIPGVPLAEVLRPTFQTSTIPYDPTPLLFTDPEYLDYAPIKLPLLLTTTKNEGGSAIQQIFGGAIPSSNSTFHSSLVSLLGQSRADDIIKSKVYQLGTEEDTLRATLERLVTDGIWRCPARQVALNWAKAGGKVWVGEWRMGATYPTNEKDYCTAEGRVCHEDDLYLTFDTSPSTSHTPPAFEEEIITRWISFIRTEDPNPRIAGSKGCRILNETLPSWLPYRTSHDTFPLGGDGLVEECPDIWGSEVQYDWQIFGQ